MTQPGFSGNYDKAGEREWLRYEYWTPGDFALNNNLSVRTVRHLMTLGLPVHGKPHKGKGGIRLGRSAVKWLTLYRSLTEYGCCRFDPSWISQDDLDSMEIDDDRQAYARLYGAPIPADEYIRTHAAERRSWKVKFREIKRRS